MRKASTAKQSSTSSKPKTATPPLSKPKRTGSKTSPIAGGLQRVVIGKVEPTVDEGLFAIKRIVGEHVTVQAVVFTDGHHALDVRLQYRHRSKKAWKEIPMKCLGNDLWEATFGVQEQGFYDYAIEAWVDPFLSWCHDLEKKVHAKQEVGIELLVGQGWLKKIAPRARGVDAQTLQGASTSLGDPKRSEKERVELALNPGLLAIVSRYPDRSRATRSPKFYPVLVERERAAFSAWYEFFPRSWGENPGQHGTFKSCEKILPEIAQMGFDVVYLPPIHPIGTTHRKGKNNTLEAQPGDVGSPWAIGSSQGGHKSIHPELGSLSDFKRFIKKAKALDLEVALDIAFQCSPDHPYIHEHPEWFSWRPDGTIQYAENPPKKYQDVVPFDFECEAWQSLWEELKSVFDYWIEQGVKIFRVDNPHTKPMAFWHWLIEGIKTKHPEVLFLAEAFTRPHVKYWLGKAGFTWGYTYFTWRHSRDELTSYLQELTSPETREYFRPHFWPNTPDILPPALQFDGRAAFIIRLILAATLSSNYGIYGPAFELGVHEGVEGKEEYLYSEKYEIKHWNWQADGNIKEILTRVNRIRLHCPALQQTNHFIPVATDHPALIAYLKKSDSPRHFVLVVVNLDPHNAQSCWLDVPIEQFHVHENQPYLMTDLLADGKYLWQGRRNFVRLEPQICPAHIFEIATDLRREQDFDYYL